MGVVFTSCCQEGDPKGTVVESGNFDVKTHSDASPTPGSHKSVLFSHEEVEDGEHIPIRADDGDEDFTDFESTQDDSPSHTDSGKIIKRNMTFQIMNSVSEHQEDKHQNIEHVGDFKTMLRKQSTDLDLLKETAGDGQDYNAELERRKDDMLSKVADLVDKSYDILPAEAMLAALEKMISQERFTNEVIPTNLFERFLRKLDYFYDVGVTCSQSQDDWLEIYNADKGRQTLHGFIDTEDASVLHYCARIEIPTSLTNVLAVANEINLMQKWNSLVVKEPETIGRRTAHYMVLNYQVSAVAGMYKVDVLNEIRRFSDAEGGFLVEYVSSVKKDHPSFKEPLKGYKRMQTLLKNVFLACGPNCTVLIQIGKLKLPFSATKWLAKTLGGIAGKFIIGGLVTNSMRAADANSPWKGAIQEDPSGLYGRLNECVACDASKRRDPANSEDGRAANVKVEECFNGRRFHRASQRIVNRGIPSGEH